MQAEQLVKAGRLNDAMVALQDQVRKSPADAKLRMFLFQLLCVMGQWERAITQLGVASEMDAGQLLTKELYGPAIQCEVFRAEVFAGKRAPLIFGEPEEWVGLMVQACQLQAQGKFDAAIQLREKAIDAAPAVAGIMDGKKFAWIMDADARLGPIFEVIINGKYYWVPMSRVASIKFEKPVDLRDAVWAQAHFIWTNGGGVSGIMPARYPGSQTSDAKHALSRQTDWNEVAPGVQEGVGQRLFATDEGDAAILEVTEIVFEIPSSVIVSPEGTNA